MSLFTHEARQFKFDVLREVSKRAFEGTISVETPDEVAVHLIPTNKADFRCCVYKEREVIRERTRLAMGKKPNIIRKDECSPKQIVHVLEAACDGCSIHKVQITNNCRKCMAKACMSSCKFGAIKMGDEHAYIDYNVCKSCGACAKACPYSAIVVAERPCVRSCPVNAITMDENDLCLIDETKCISCGACQAGCPFGAIEDISQVTQVVEALKSEQEVVAVVAPSIQGQMGKATLPQIMQSIRQLGFDDVIEAAVAADAVAVVEKGELLEHKAEGKKMTTSCCPAFVNMARIHFPTVYENHVSHVVSPMEAMARQLKQTKDCKVVFVGPCVAKKQEAMNDWSVVDYVLTFEEMAAMLISQHIYPNGVQPTTKDIASAYGKNFAIGGGVSKAVVQACKEDGDEVAVSAKYADGAAECKMNLLLMKLGKFNEDILEGMACIGGCVNGPATIESPAKAKQAMVKENVACKDQKIREVLETVDFTGVNMHR